jgi:hypothetical protein
MYAKSFIESYNKIIEQIIKQNIDKTTLNTQNTDKENKMDE